MANEYNSFELYSKTLSFCYDPRVKSGGEDNFFFPIGVFLLKWINDSKENFNWVNDFNYNNIINCSYNIKENLISVSQNIENSNPYLKDIFTQLCFSNINYIDETYLKEIISFYLNFNFNTNDSEMNFTKEFMDYLLFYLYESSDQFSFMSPPSIANLLSQLFDISENENTNILDIACGTGSLLSKALSYNKQNSNNINLYGQDINIKATLICKVNLLLRGVQYPKINTRNTLTEPIIFDYDNKIDIVLSNLPLGLKYNPYEIGYKDDFIYGIPSATYADWLFIQRGLATLKNTGRAAFVVSSGTLSRVSETKIRKAFLEEDIIEAVITLPSNLNKGSNIRLEILIINKDKNESLKEKVLFIDASKEFHKISTSSPGEPITNVNVLESEHINKIVNIYKSFSKGENVEKNNNSVIVHFSDIEKNNFSLIGEQYIYHNSIHNEKLNMINLEDIALVKRGLQITKDNSLELINSKNDLISYYDKNNLNKNISLEDLPYYIKINNLNNDTIEFNDRVINLSDKQIDAYMLKPNDILISARGTLIKTAVYENDMPPCVFSGNIILIRTNPNKYNAYFLKFYLDSNDGNQAISRMQNGTSIISLNPNALKTLKIPDINYAEQNKLSERIIENEKIYKERVEKAKSIYEQNLKNINEDLMYSIEY
jgi:type I restriction enzyme M protein